MRSLPVQALLDVWEEACSQTPLRRALVLVALVSSEQDGEALERMPIGVRNTRLLEMRRHLFGPRLRSVADCPACGERLELDLGVADLLEPGAEARPAATLESNGFRLHLSAPTSRDLEAAEEAGSLEKAREMLLCRCVSVTDADGSPVGVSSLPDSVQRKAVEELAALDPLASIELTMSCALCRHSWPTKFDIAAHLWTELHTWALGMMRDVHTLARAYGWREADILAMSAWKRQVYLDLIEGNVVR